MPDSTRDVELRERGHGCAIESPHTLGEQRLRRVVPFLLQRSGGAPPPDIVVSAP